MSALTLIPHSMTFFDVELSIQGHPKPFTSGKHSIKYEYFLSKKSWHLKPISLVLGYILNWPFNPKYILAIIERKRNTHQSQNTRDAYVTSRKTIYKYFDQNVIAMIGNVLLKYTHHKH